MTQKVFESCAEASRFYKVHTSNTIMSCQGKILCAGILDDGRHLYWKYYADYCTECSQFQQIENQNEKQKVN